MRQGCNIIGIGRSIENSVSIRFAYWDRIFTNQQHIFNQNIIGYVRAHQETAALSKRKIHTQPETANHPGTGLGSLASEITEKYEIKYEEIPNFPALSTAEGHSGNLLFGKARPERHSWQAQGRFHFYEGYSMKEVTFPGTCNARTGYQDLIRFQCQWRHNPICDRRPDDYHRPV